MNLTVILSKLIWPVLNHIILGTEMNSLNTFSIEYKIDLMLCYASAESGYTELPVPQPLR